VIFAAVADATFPVYIAHTCSASALDGLSVVLLASRLKIDASYDTV